MSWNARSITGLHGAFRRVLSRTIYLPDEVVHHGISFVEVNLGELLLFYIRFLLSTMLTDDRAPLRMCRYCYKPFIASNTDEEYCSEVCKEDSKK